MTRYAENTSVSVEGSKAEIERLLQRYGADQFISGWDQKKAYILFRMADRQVKFELPLPDKNDPEFTCTPSRRQKRSESKAFEAWEQGCRRKWRALALVVKAKLEAVESGITTFQDEFLAHVMLPDGSTVSEFIIPQIEIAYENGEMPRLLTWKKPE